MAGDDPMIAELRQWVQKAENALKNAAHTLKLGADCPTDTVCFHAQQCVEKYLKALLTSRGTRFPRTHDLVVLVELLPRNICDWLHSVWRPIRPAPPASVSSVRSCS